MGYVDDKELVKIYAKIASIQNISIAAARRKIDAIARKKRIKDINLKKEIALEFLSENEDMNKDKQSNISAHTFNVLLKALEEEENFMTED